MNVFSNEGFVGIVVLDDEPRRKIATVGIRHSCIAVFRSVFQVDGHFEDTIGEGLRMEGLAAVDRIWLGFCRPVVFRQAGTCPARTMVDLQVTNARLAHLKTGDHARNPGVLNAGSICVGKPTHTILAGFRFKAKTRVIVGIKSATTGSDRDVVQEKRTVAVVARDVAITCLGGIILESCIRVVIAIGKTSEQNLAQRLPPEKQETG